MKNIKNQFVEYAIVLAVMLIFAFIYHFDFICSGFELFPGDDCDAFLNVLAADSWEDVFRGEHEFRQNRIFYPFPHARGFTDLSLSLYFLTLPFRVFLGMGMFSSASIVYWLLFHFGILSMFYLLRKILHLNFAAALGGAILSFYCNACWVKLNHTQFFFIGLLPFLAVCVIRYCQYWYSDRTLPRIMYGIGALLTFACIAYSNYYTSFFFGFAMAIFFIVYWILLAKEGKLKKVFIPKRIGEVIFLLLCGALLFLPFFYTYSVFMNDNYERSWTAAQGTLPTLADIVNVGPDNLLWGKLYDFAFPPIHKYVYENYHGLPLITLGVMLFGLYYFWKKRKIFGPVCFAVAAMMALLYIISLKFAHCVSLWYFVWKFVPGGSAIRAGGRIYVFMMFPLMVFLWWMVDHYSRRFTSGKRLLLCGILFAVLAVDNFNGITVYGWRPSEKEQFIAKITPPPAEVKYFFVIDSAGGNPAHANIGKYGLTAWYIARQFKIFTINGYSGNMPVGYFAVDPLAPEYRDEIGKWVRKNHLTETYSYDIATDKWQKENFGEPEILQPQIIAAPSGQDIPEYKTGE